MDFDCLDDGAAEGNSTIDSYEVNKNSQQIRMMWLVAQGLFGSEGMLKEELQEIQARERAKFWVRKAAVFQHGEL